MNGKREYGDYQTPIQFAEKVCHYLKDYRHFEPSAIIDKTIIGLIQKHDNKSAVKPPLLGGFFIFGASVA